METARRFVGRIWRELRHALGRTPRARRPEIVWAPGSAMPYRLFLARYGGAARTKNLAKAGLRKDVLPATAALPADFIRLDPWEIEFLYALARRAKVGIVEIGRLMGGSTFLLACANPVVPIYSIDLAPRDDATLQHLLRSNEVGGNVRLLVGDSQRGRFDAVAGYDLLFIDGDHTPAGCAADIANWYQALRPGGYIVFHDCYLAGEGVQDAVLDFLESANDLQVIASPVIGMSHWRYPAGSMACFRKRPA